MTFASIPNGSQIFIDANTLVSYAWARKPSARMMPGRLGPVNRLFPLS